MAVSFEGFPRTLERKALRAGRWFVVAEGVRPVLCFATDIEEGGDRLVLTFRTAGVEIIEFAPSRVSALTAPFASVEDEIVFAPGLNERRPMLVTPGRRSFDNGSLLRLKSGDLGIGVTGKGGGLAIVSLTTGEQSEGFDLVFDRWSLSLRRGAAETLLGYFKPLAYLSERRRG
jgi:hypothetical protein